MYVCMYVCMYVYIYIYIYTYIYMYTYRKLWPWSRSPDRVLSSSGSCSQTWHLPINLSTSCLQRRRNVDYHTCEHITQSCCNQTPPRTTAISVPRPLQPMHISTSRLGRRHPRFRTQARKRASTQARMHARPPARAPSRLPARPRAHPRVRARAHHIHACIHYIYICIYIYIYIYNMYIVHMCVYRLISVRSAGSS